MIMMLSSIKTDIVATHPPTDVVSDLRQLLRMDIVFMLVLFNVEYQIKLI